MKDSCKYSAIILSAGLSSRMNGFKPLLKFGGVTAVEMIIRTFISAGIEDVLVIVGHRAEEIVNVLKKESVRCILNEKYKEGMSSSVLKALSEIDKDSKGFFLIPVDIPLIKIKTLELLKEEFLKGEKGIIYPQFKGKKGHPPLISTKYKNNIIKNIGSGGLREVLSLYEKDSSTIEVIDNGILLDMDTLEDYNNLLNYFTFYDTPNEEECSAILRKYSVPEKIVSHGEAVAATAVNIAQTLNRKGKNLNINKIRAAALLHDIVRQEKNHAEAAGKIMRSLGYREIGDIIEVHMDISVNEKEEITEKEIVYLADKLNIDSESSSLKERFNKAFKKYCHDTEIIKRIEQRLKNSEKIAEKINCIEEIISYE